MRIGIKNFQSLGDVRLEAEGLTVIVGRSNLGKSATVRALEGALFNRAGDDFVRLGAKEAEVILERVPTADGSVLMDVAWTKGANANRYVIDGETFAKVGQSAPSLLQDAGYRDIKTGAEWMRPQVAGQFDPLFLLTRPGSFISDVLTTISRLGVLLQADRACTKDVKAQRALLGVRLGDLERAKRVLEDLQPIEGLQARVEALGAAQAEVDTLTARVAAARALMAARARLVAATALALPEAVEVPAGLGDRFRTSQGLVAHLRRLRPVRQVEVPPAADHDLSGVEGRPAVLEAARGVSRRLQPLRTLVGMQVPAHADVPVEAVSEALSLAVSTRALVGALLARRGEHGAARQSVRASTQEHEHAQAELDAALSALEVCPLCDRPMEGHRA